MRYAVGASHLVERRGCFVSGTAVARVDAKGRLSIPRRLREELGIEPGDTFFIERDNGLKVLRLAKADDPFDVLAEHAIREYRAGRTKSLPQVADELGIDLDEG